MCVMKCDGLEALLVCTRKEVRDKDSRKNLDRSKWNCNCLYCVLACVCICINVSIECMNRWDRTIEQ